MGHAVENEGDRIHTTTGAVDSKGASKRTDNTAAHGNVNVDSFSRTNIDNRDVGRNGDVSVVKSDGSRAVKKKFDHKEGTKEKVVGTKDGEGGSARTVDAVNTKSDEDSVNIATSGSFKRKDSKPAVDANG